MRLLQEDRAGKQGEDILGLTADQAEFSDYSNNNNKRQVPKVTRPGSNKPVFQLRQAVRFIVGTSRW